MKLVVVSDLAAQGADELRAEAKLAQIGGVLQRVLRRGSLRSLCLSLSL